MQDAPLSNKMVLCGSLCKAVQVKLLEAAWWLAAVPAQCCCYQQLYVLEFHELQHLLQALLWAALVEPGSRGEAETAQHQAD